MKNFKNFLSNLVGSCDGLYGAVVMGFDGVTRSRYFNAELPKSSDVYEAFIADYSALIENFCRKSDMLGVGKTDSLSIYVGDLNIYFKILNKNNILAVISSKKAIIGKVEYYSNIEAKRFNEAFGE